MLEIVATLCGIVFGGVGMAIAFRNHIRQLRSDFDKRLQSEIDKQADSKLKSYAAERDFQHLKRNNDQLKDAVVDLQDEMEKIKATVLELQITSRAALNRLEMIAARLDGGNTGGLMRNG